MNKLISYFTNKKKSNKIKLNIFKRNSSKTNKAPSRTNLNDCSFADNSMSNSSSVFTISTQASSDLSLLNKTQIVQDSTLESATLEEMYADNINVVASNVKLIGYSNDSFQLSVNQSFDSIQNLDSTIRSKLSQLKATARQHNIQLPAHITMLETVYNLRMNNLQREYLITQKKLEEKRQVNKLVKHILNASKLIRSHTAYWSKSVNIKSQSKYHDLECQLKKQMDSIQTELMTTLCEIELRFKKEQQQHRLIQHSNRRQKTTYFTEVALQKRIRLNKKRLHRSAIVVSSSDLSKSRNNSKFLNLTHTVI